MSQGSSRANKASCFPAAEKNEDASSPLHSASSQSHQASSGSALFESGALKKLVENALAEDISTGDITGMAIVPEDSVCSARLVLKEPAVIAGLQVFEFVMQNCDPKIVFEPCVVDSQRIEQVPFCLAFMQGKSRALLAAERTALNLIQRMCGIATLTNRYVELAAQHDIEILDTRKTTPGLRLLEKTATRLGGATNHRFGLYDGILIKDNHRAIAGGVTNALRLARQSRPGMPIEIEVNTAEQLEEALELGVERVMLDNMSPAEVAYCVKIAAAKALKAGGPPSLPGRAAVEAEAGATSNCKTYIEVSGGVNLENLTDYLIPGVNGISIGALTHSVKNIDISLEFEDLSHAKY